MFRIRVYQRLLAVQSVSGLCFASSAPFCGDTGVSHPRGNRSGVERGVGRGFEIAVLNHR
jgi:hypothetical protein